MIRFLASASLFVLAGLCEIGGGYLIWIWLRGGRSWLVGLVGGCILVVYGIVPTLQPLVLTRSRLGFGRVYASYGAIFIVMSMLWGWGVDGKRPDRWDSLGAAICLLGAAVMMYWPRR